MRCQFEAQSYLNAYKLLNQNNYTFMEQSASGKPVEALETMSTDIVCLAFALELFLKDLHFSLGKKIRGHEIRELFVQLPEDIQQEIVGYHLHERGSPFFSYQAKTPRDKLMTKVDEVSDGFMKWRYSHERSSLHYDISFVLEFIDTIKSVTTRIDRMRVNTRAI